MKTHPTATRARTHIPVLSARFICSGSKAGSPVIMPLSINTSYQPSFYQFSTPLSVMDILCISSAYFLSSLCGFYLVRLSPSCLPLSLSLDLKPLMKNKQDGKPPLSSSSLHFLFLSLPHHLVLSYPPPPLVSLLHPSHLSSSCVFFLFFMFLHSQHGPPFGEEDEKIHNIKSAPPGLPKWRHTGWWNHFGQC